VLRFEEEGMAGKVPPPRIGLRRGRLKRNEEEEEEEEAGIVEAMTVGVDDDEEEEELQFRDDSGKTCRSLAGGKLMHGSVIHELKEIPADGQSRGPW